MDFRNVRNEKNAIDRMRDRAPEVEEDMHYKQKRAILLALSTWFSLALTKRFPLKSWSGFLPSYFLRNTFSLVAPSFISRSNVVVAFFLPCGHRSGDLFFFIFPVNETESMR